LLSDWRDILWIFFHARGYSLFRASDFADSLGWLLLGNGGAIGLLLKESPSLVRFLLQVLNVGDQLHGVHNTVVVEEHASDLSGGLAILLLDHSVDAVTDLLASGSRLHLAKCHGVNLREGVLLLLLLGHHLLLSHHLLVRSHLATHSGNATSGGTTGLLTVGSTTASVSLVVAGTSAVVVLVGSLTAVLSLALALTSLVVVLTVLTVAAHAAVVLHAGLAVLLATTDGSVVKVLHEVLLDFVEGALLTFLVKLLSGHPELDGESAGTEGSRLVEALNGLLGAVNVSVQDEVLSVGSTWVEIFALSQLDADDGTNFFEESGELSLFDLAGDVLNEQVRFIGSSHTALNGSGISVVSSNLVFSLGDMLANEQVGSTFHVFFVHGIDGSLRGLAGLERDVALVR